jgi:hypothetical protein
VPVIIKNLMQQLPPLTVFDGAEQDMNEEHLDVTKNRPICPIRNTSSCRVPSLRYDHIQLLHLPALPPLLSGQVLARLADRDTSFFYPYFPMYMRTSTHDHEATARSFTTELIPRSTRTLYCLDDHRFCPFWVSLPGVLMAGEVFLFPFSIKCPPQMIYSQAYTRLDST